MTVFNSVSTSTSHKMALFASLRHIEHHRRWQCLPLSVILNITQEGFASFSLNYIKHTDSTSYKTSPLTFPFQFKNRTPSGCNQASTCAVWIQKGGNYLNIFFNPFKCTVFKTLCFQTDTRSIILPRSLIKYANTGGHLLGY